MKQYLINNYNHGLDLKIKHMKFLISKNITNSFEKKYDITLEQYKTLFLDFINFKDGYFKILEKYKKEQLCITPISDLDEQYLVLFTSISPKQHKASYIDLKDSNLRSNKHVINSLKTYSYYSVVEVEEPNLSHVTITHDLKTNREILVATYSIPGGKIPFYVHKIY